MTNKKRKSNKKKRENTVGSSNWISTTVRGCLLSALITDLEIYEETGLDEHSICQMIEANLRNIQTDVINLDRNNNLSDEQSSQYRQLYTKWKDFNDTYHRWNIVGYKTPSVSEDIRQSRLEARNRLIEELKRMRGKIENSSGNIINDFNKFNANLAHQQLSQLNTLANSTVTLSNGSNRHIRDILPYFSTKIQHVSSMLPHR